MEKPKGNRLESFECTKFVGLSRYVVTFRYHNRYWSSTLRMLPDSFTKLINLKNLTLYGWSTVNELQNFYNFLSLEP